MYAAKRFSCGPGADSRDPTQQFYIRMFFYDTVMLAIGTLLALWARTLSRPGFSTPVLPSTRVPPCLGPTTIQWCRRYSHLMYRFTGLAVACCLAAGIPLAAKEKVAQDLKKTDPAQTVDVIVRAKPSQKAAAHQKVQGKGGQKLADFDGINSALYRMPAGGAAALETDDEIDGVQPN